MNSLFAFALVAVFVMALYAVYRRIYPSESFSYYTPRPYGFQGINTGVPIRESYNGGVYSSCSKK